MARKEEKAGSNVVLGTVVSIDDPTYSGRIKVKIDGYLDSSTEQLPWCSYGGSAFNSANGGGSISVARVGQQVRIKFPDGEDHPESMEWYAVSEIDPKLIEELQGDYAQSQILLYDSANDISIKWQSKSGLIMYYAGSYIQISPDNTVTIHYGLGETGTQIQLSECGVDIQAPWQINLTTSGTINLEADNIVLNAKSKTQITGSEGAETAVNGINLMAALSFLASQCDSKVPMTPGFCTQTIESARQSILNRKIEYM